MSDESEFNGISVGDFLKKDGKLYRVQELTVSREMEILNVDNGIILRFDPDRENMDAYTHYKKQERRYDD